MQNVINHFIHGNPPLDAGDHPPTRVAQLLSLTSVENQIIKLETLEAVVEWMAAVSAKFLDEIAAVRSVSRNAGLVGQVERLIEAHLTDANLSVKMLSDELGLSVNYIRNLYKNETNRSITETISEKRLSIICEELISSEAPIEPIVLKYGFSSLNTFYIAFKKDMVLLRQSTGNPIRNRSGPWIHTHGKYE